MKRENIILLLVFVVLAAVPFLADLTGQSSWIKMVGQALIYGMAAASLNFILGYGGMVSFGHAAFFGIGGYVVGIMYHHFDAGTLFLGVIPGTDQMLITLPAAMLAPVPILTGATKAEFEPTKTFSPMSVICFSKPS